jgi:hypothetical protein
MADINFPDPSESPWEDPNGVIWFHDGDGWLNNPSDELFAESILTGYKNVIINGDFRINQRAVGHLTDGTYGVDQWVGHASNLEQRVEEGNYKPNAQYILSGVNVPTEPKTAPASGTWAIYVPRDASNIQLELGTLATGYELRSYALELSLCQRYLYRPKSGSTYGALGVGIARASESRIVVPFPVVMRALPVATQSGDLRIFGTATESSAALTTYVPSTHTCLMYFNKPGGVSGEVVLLTGDNRADAYVSFSAEL